MYVEMATLYGSRISGQPKHTRDDMHPSRPPTRSAFTADSHPALRGRVGKAYCKPKRVSCGMLLLGAQSIGRPGDFVHSTHPVWFKLSPFWDKSKVRE